MDPVRVVGQRSSHGKCAYCLEDIVEDVDPCARCGLLTHAACAEELGRCPTLGCGAELDRPRVVVSPAELHAERPTPGLDARLETWLRLTAAPLILTAPAVLAVLLTIFVVQDARQLEDLLCFSPYLLGGLFFPLAWLLSIRRAVQSAVRFHRVLHEPTTQPMRLLLTEPGLRFTAILQPIGGGPQIVYRNPSLPGWVQERGGETVFVRGIAAGGPYVLEFADGRIALLNTR